MAPSLIGKVCLVTGASRGIGRGIALQLGQAGATIYVTGRHKPALNDCVFQMKERGAKEAIPIQVDHSNDEEVEQMFSQISKDRGGQLDLLVNNAYAGVDMISQQMKKPFWRACPYETWDTINGVGLRNHFACTSFASRMMTKRKSGLIINISSYGGLRYLFNVAYGIGKMGKDRMASDCAHELKKYNVAMVSLWPGAVKTEKMMENVLDNELANKKSKAMFEGGESVEFPGIAITHLACDKEIMKKSGKILWTSNLAREYGFHDIDGAMPDDWRSVNYLLKTSGKDGIAHLFPRSLRVPMFMIHYGSYKF